MAKEFLVNKDYNNSITPNGSWVPGNPTYTEKISSKVLLNNKNLLIDELKWNMAGCNLPSYTFVSGNGKITATSLKIKSISFAPLRENDQGLCNGSFIQNDFPFATLPCNCLFKIVSAGQIKVTGE